MHRESSPWSASPGRRHDFGHTDEGDYARRGEPGHEPAFSGGGRSARGSNYGDWRGDPSHGPDPYSGGGRWGEEAPPPDRHAEAGDRFRGRGPDGAGGAGFGAQDVPGRYQGGYRGGHGQGDQGAGGFQGSPQRSVHSGYPGMYEDPYAGAHENASYAGPYTGQSRGRCHPRSPSYGRWEEPGQQARYGDSRQDSPQPGYSGEAWADADWQHDQGSAARHGHHDDPDYRQWREEQMRRLDEDYRLWRQDRYKKFSEDFDAWRNRRQQTPQQQQGGAGQSSVGAGPGNPTQVSGIPGAAGGRAEAGAPRSEGQDATTSRGDAGTSSAGNTGHTTSGGHNAAVPGGGNDQGKGLGG